MECGGGGRALILFCLTAYSQTLCGIKGHYQGTGFYLVRCQNDGVYQCNDTILKRQKANIRISATFKKRSFFQIYHTEKSKNRGHTA